tara:strand:- start:55 stop:267 length:213 start_codon:yes stop_codon:yes gene_type:complete
MKYFLLIMFLSLFTFGSASAEKNCSELKKLSKDYLKCLSGNFKKKSSNIGLDTENIKQKKYISDWFKKKK